MNFGYLLIISKSDKFDYLKLAYALAVSIKNTQKSEYNKVALVTDDVDAVKNLASPWVFDKVIEFKDETYWDGRVWMDRLTPFDTTVCLDVDMLFFEDCSHWIDPLYSAFDLYLPSTAYTYRGEKITSDYYRKAFTKNSLPNLYSFFTFFKKDSEIVSEFFKLARYITKHPTDFSNTFMEKHKPRIVGTDEAMALSAKILGIEDYVTADLSYPHVVHLKPEVQNWPWSTGKVSDQVGFYLGTNGKLKIGNYNQTGIVHCAEKELITDEIVSILEGVLWKK